MIPIAVCALLIALGLRVCVHAQRAGAAPDRAVGLFFVCMGVGALPGLSPQLLPISVDHHQPAIALGQAAISVGYAFLAVFVWQCFEPESSWRRRATVASVAVLAALWMAHGWIDGFSGGTIIRITVVARAAILAWAFAETFSYRERLRKQLAIGLGDPVVANRFTLWCLWTASLLSINLVMVGLRWLVPEFEAAPAWLQGAVMLVLPSFALVAAASLGLAFFPPRWYSARVRGSQHAA